MREVCRAGNRRIEEYGRGRATTQQTKQCRSQWHGSVNARETGGHRDLWWSREQPWGKNQSHAKQRKIVVDGTYDNLKMGTEKLVKN